MAVSQPSALAAKAIDGGAGGRLRGSLLFPCQRENEVGAHLKRGDVRQQLWSMAERVDVAVERTSYEGDRLRDHDAKLLLKNRNQNQLHAKNGPNYGENFFRRAIRYMYVANPSSHETLHGVVRETT
jgi:hypothetical protein